MSSRADPPDSPDDLWPIDAAIVGAGPAGSSLAIRLARAGARIALIDAGRFPRDKLCGEYLSPEGALALEGLGLADAIARSGARPIRAARLTTPRGRRLEAEVVGPDGRAGLGLSRSALDAILLGEARRLGVIVFEGTRVSGPILEGDRVVGVAGRGVGGSPFSLRARVVVAADGRHSSLARRTGSTLPRSVPGLRPRLFGLKRHLVVRDPACDEPPGTVGLHLLPGGYVGSCRVEGSRTNLCGLLPERLSREHRGDLDALADAAFLSNPTLAALWHAAEPAGPWKTVAGVRIEASSPLLPGIFYAGDARGTIDPLGGQGLTMALLGSELLAPFVLQSIAQGAADLTVVREAIRAWHSRFDRRIALCRAFHHALIRPSLIDAASMLGRWGDALLSLGFASTRDRARLPS
ncbi:NAD(P)/FAD-dependent oxidoreductase [Tautonia sociabilis]|uniref:NAD(P)/FAD-dependent oxidoreductase n=1 Tax=Tautonia sociabilis TaxID=2080755 RepID=A0A432MRL1_9BACT|nr:NAD(P)/FAD-dependent oxidoreductase [Tautonia sociabilis]RUL89595.1 NAD(P)/FAD-dependent oxidoreductase [Tautonia sociabilis]